MNITLSPSTAVSIMLLLLCAGTSAQQTGRTAGTAVNDAAAGLSFTSPAPAVKSGDGTYRIMLPAQNAEAEVSVGIHPSIDLPGSYGGRLFLDSPDAASLLQSRVLVDTVRTETASYSREYWTVYAGMGMWDCVIRCSSIGTAAPVAVMLVQQMAGGKPGETAGTTPLTTATISSELLMSLRDPRSETNRTFNALLSSVRFTGGAKEVR